MKISSSSTFTKESQENDCLRNQIQQLESNINSSKETIDILEEKISKVESAALKSYEEKNAELAKLRNLVKGLNVEVASNKKDLNQRNKTVQEKEKEILKLNQKCTNLVSNVSNLKSEIKTLKQENQKLVKQKTEKHKKSHNVATNTLTITFDECTSTGINFSSSPSMPSTSRLSVNSSVPIKHMTMLSMDTTDELDPVEDISEATTSEARSVTQCSHSPQCVSRHPDIPPPFAPLTFSEYYYPPKPPANIRLLPDQRLTYPEYCKLQVSHTCVECEVGTMYHNYTEKVEYSDPGPCGGVMGTYPLACPPKSFHQIEKY